MSPVVKLVILVVLVIVVVRVLAVIRASRREPVSFTPVGELAPEVRQTIEAALARGEADAAVQHYRAATGADPLEAKAAVETHHGTSRG